MPDSNSDDWKPTQQYFREASTQFSQIVRQSTLGGIGLAWLFAEKDASNRIVQLPVLFVVASIVLVISILIDAAQYYYTAVILDRILAKGDDPEIPRENTATMVRFFHAKAVVGALGLSILAIALVRELLIRN